MTRYRRLTVGSNMPTLGRELLSRYSDTELVSFFTTWCGCKDRVLNIGGSVGIPKEVFYRNMSRQRLCFRETILTNNFYAAKSSTGTPIRDCSSGTLGCSPSCKTAPATSNTKSSAGMSWLFFGGSGNPRPCEAKLVGKEMEGIRDCPSLVPKKVELKFAQLMGDLLAHTIFFRAKKIDKVIWQSAEALPENQSEKWYKPVAVDATTTNGHRKTIKRSTVDRPWRVSQIP